MGKFRLDLLPVAFFPIIWILIVFVFPAKISGIRKDIGLPENRVCRNTVQGRYLLSDNNGYVCTALSVDSLSRCCPEIGERFSCHGCNLVSQCCNSYEYCVSCCLHPSRTKEDLVLKVKIAKPITAGTYASVFDFCAGRCRHNSASVVHENAYASNFHHCFSLQSNFSGIMELSSEARLTGIDIVTGKQGESCNSACRSNKQSCVPNRLLVLNKCEFLQRYMNCKGGCFASIGADQPAEVVDDAPNDVQKNLGEISTTIGQTEGRDEVIHVPRNNSGVNADPIFFRPLEENTVLLSPNIINASLSSFYAIANMG